MPARETFVSFHDVTFLSGTHNIRSDIIEYLNMSKIRNLTNLQGTT